MPEARLPRVAYEEVAEERAQFLGSRNRRARGLGKGEDGARRQRIVELPVLDLLRLGRGIVDQILERGLGERRTRRDGRAVVQPLRPAPLHPRRVLVGARAAPVVFVPFARAAARQDVRADAVAPAAFGVVDEVEHPPLRLGHPLGIARGVRDVREGVEPEPVRGPVGRVQVDHAHQPCVRADLDDVLDLRVKRRPVVRADALPDRRILAVGLAERVDGVRGEDAAVRHAHRPELPRPLRLLVETPVRDPQPPLPHLVEPDRRRAVTRGHCLGRPVTPEPVGLRRRAVLPERVESHRPSIHKHESEPRLD